MSHTEIYITLLIVSIAVGYLLGSIPFGMVLTKMAGLGDIRSIGSGNIGATNVLRTGRKDLALTTLFLDAAKAGLAYLLVAQFSFAVFKGIYTPQQILQARPDAVAIGVIAGAAAFIGHCFPVWLKFKGGKGVATYLGLVLVSMWQAGLAFAGVWLITAAVFRMSSAGALAATIATPIAAYIVDPQGISWMIYGTLSALIWFRHRPNIERILKGTEPKIGSKKKDAASAPP